MNAKLVASIAAFVVLAAGCGPGAQDGCFQVAGEYYICDDGGQGRTLARRRGVLRFETIIEARIDQAEVTSMEILIARRPVTVVHRPNGSAGWKVQERCEFLVLDIATGKISEIELGDERRKLIQCASP